jgi:hypothetical protein
MHFYVPCVLHAPSLSCPYQSWQHSVHHETEVLLRLMPWEKYERKRSWPTLKYYPTTCMEILQRIMNILGHDSQSLDRESNQAPSPPPPKTKEPGLLSLDACYVTSLWILRWCCCFMQNHSTSLHTQWEQPTSWWNKKFPVKAANCNVLRQEPPPPNTPPSSTPAAPTHYLVCVELSSWSLLSPSFPSFVSRYSLVFFINSGTTLAAHHFHDVAVISKMLCSETEFRVCVHNTSFGTLSFGI